MTCLACSSDSAAPNVKTISLSPVRQIHRHLYRRAWVESGAHTAGKTNTVQGSRVGGRNRFAEKLRPVGRYRTRDPLVLEYHSPAKSSCKRSREDRSCYRINPGDDMHERLIPRLAQHEFPRAVTEKRRSRPERFTILSRVNFTEASMATYRVSSLAILLFLILEDTVAEAVSDIRHPLRGLEMETRHGRSLSSRMYKAFASACTHRIVAPGRQTKFVAVLRPRIDVSLSDTTVPNCGLAITLTQGSGVLAGAQNHDAIRGRRE